MQNQRIINVRESMQKQGIPALLVSNPLHRRYLTGFTGSAGMVLVTEHKAILFTDFRYRTQAPEQVGEYGIEVFEHGADMLNDLYEQLNHFQIRKLGFEATHLSYADVKKYQAKLTDIEWIDTEGVIEKLRLIKDPDEQKVIEEAAKLADDTFLYILGEIQAGVVEKEIQNKLEFYMRSHGADSSSFDTIVASGERSALPHGVASEKVLQMGELITLDFGAYYEGYCSDITRTIMLGKPTDKQKEIYEVVLEAQMLAVEQIQPGMTGKQADAIARDIIKKYGYADYFGHGTGHGLGMEVHEAPRLSPRSSDILEPGMVVTVEPGIYIPGVGGVRIEDDLLITNEGTKRLSQSNKDLKILKL